MAAFGYFLYCSVAVSSKLALLSFLLPLSLLWFLLVRPFKLCKYLGEALRRGSHVLACFEEDLLFANPYHALPLFFITSPRSREDGRDGYGC